MAREKPVLGQWIDRNQTSPLFGLQGVLRLDNMTTYIVRNLNSTMHSGQSLNSQNQQSS